MCYMTISIDHRGLYNLYIMKRQLFNALNSKAILLPSSFIEIYNNLYHVTTAKDFIRNMMEKNPAKRFLTEQALGHPW